MAQLASKPIQGDESASYSETKQHLIFRQPDFRLEDLFRDNSDSFDEVGGVVHIEESDVEALDEDDEMDIGTHIRDNPGGVIGAAVEVFDEPVQFHGGYEKTIQSLRSEHVGKLVQIDARVVDLRQPLLRVAEADFWCDKCRSRVTVPQPQDKDYIQGPNDVEFALNDSGVDDDCSHNWDHEEDRDVTVDFQQAIVQDEYTEVNKAQPEDMLLHLHNNLVGQVEPGDRIRLSAILHRERGDETISKMFLDAVGIESRESDVDLMEVDDEDIEQIQEMAERRDIREHLAATIAPTLAGDYSLPRKVALSQIFQGVTRQVGANQKRGMIHALFVGDPGCGKSQLAEEVAELSPAGLYKSGDGATKVGLTAAATHEERFNETQWSLSAGALVQADGDICVVDEIDKASTKARKALHEPMSQLRIHVNKADIDTELNTRTSVLAVANPVDDRFTIHSPLITQINLNQAFIDRIDAVVPFEDVVDEEADEAIAESILDVSAGKTPQTVDRDLFKKYVAYAREAVRPEMTDKARDRIKEAWMNHRQESEDKRIAVSARHLESYVRFAEASARIRLSEEVEETDAEWAIDIMEEWMSLLMTDSQGRMDADRVGSSITSSERDMSEVMWSILDDYDAVPREELVVEMASEGDGTMQDAHQIINKHHPRGNIELWDGEDGNKMVSDAR